MKKILSTLIITAGALFLVSSGWAQNILAVNVTGKVRFQESKTVKTNCRTVERQQECDCFDTSVIASSVLNNKRLINLAMGQSIDASIAANLALAISLPCGDGGANLVVYDKIGSNVVVTLAEIGSFDSLDTSKVVCQTVDGLKECDAKSTGFKKSLGEVTFSSVGNASNGISGGNLKLYFTGTLDVFDCVQKVLGKRLGKYGCHPHQRFNGVHPSAYPQHRHNQWQKTGNDSVIGRFGHRFSPVPVQRIGLVLGYQAR